jgi:DNA-binding NarL/FixJ family response regulator
MQRRSSDAIKTSLRAPVLTDRQRSVLMCLYHGDPNKVIGRKLGMTETTVKVHVREIMRKLGVANRTQVAVVVGKNGFDRSADDLIVGVDAQNGTDSTNPH